MGQPFALRSGQHTAVDAPAPASGIGIVIAYPIADDLECRIGNGEHPRMEVLELARRLHAEVIDSSSARNSKSFWVRRAASVWTSFGTALLAWTRRHEFDLLYVGNENLGILLAAMAKTSRSRPRIIVINHYLSNTKKALIFRLLGLAKCIDALVCLNDCQARFLEGELNLAPDKIVRVDYGAVVDGAFFHSQNGTAASGRFALSVGRESRDYPMLFDALSNSSVRAKIVSSGLSRPDPLADGKHRWISPNIELFEHLPYHRLRKLYEDCAFLVLPVQRADYPAGITAVMEAMAMRKPVVATYSPGIGEYIEHGVTGLWVEPGSAHDLREKIEWLWNNPDLASKMGERAYESVRVRVDLDRYVAELESIIVACLSAEQ